MNITIAILPFVLCIEPSKSCNIVRSACETCSTKIHLTYSGWYTNNCATSNNNCHIPQRVTSNNLSHYFTSPSPNNTDLSAEMAAEQLEHCHPVLPADRSDYVISAVTSPLQQPQSNTQSVEITTTTTSTLIILIAWKFSRYATGGGGSDRLLGLGPGKKNWNFSVLTFSIHANMMCGVS